MYNLTDSGNSERLVARHGNKVRYVREWGWMLYDGRRWVKVDQARIVELAKETVRAMQKEAAELEDDSARSQLGKWAFDSESAYRLSAMVGLAKGALYAEAADFDKDTWLLNVWDGTINLRTGELKEHDPKDMVTKLAPVEYHGESDGKQWQAFLLEVFNNDADLIDYVQRAVGYALTGQTTEDKFFIAYGSGRNGKSTLFGVLQAALGDYASTASANLILSQGNYPKQSYDLASLIGTRFVTVYETESDKRLDVATVKQLTGGDMVTAAAKYEKPVTFRPQLKLFLSTNNKPKVDEVTPAIWERIKLIPFDVSFVGREDTGMEEKLLKELSAILRWAVDGTRKWLENGLNEPESVVEATKDYKSEQDDLDEFIRECCVIDARASVTASKLYDAYQTWLDRDVEDRLSKTAFGAEMGKRYKKKRARGGYTYYGVGLNDSLTPKAREDAYKLLREALPHGLDDDDYDPD
jgi:putative DNA primase/helicase